MRIEKLELNKIKVTVFPVDLIDMNINIKSLKPDSPQLHSFLFDVMEKVKEETGFNPYSGQIMVEASPVGDCIVLTVTRLGEKKADSVSDGVKIKRVRAVPKRKNGGSAVYFFDSFDDLCNALCNIEDETLKKCICSKIEKRYALLLRDVKMREAGILREFSQSCDAHALAAGFLQEHGEIIAQGEGLVSMAQGIKNLNLD